MIKILTPLLKINESNRSNFRIIIWWEIRRILYNLIVLVSGILSIIIMYLAAAGRVKLEPGEDLFEPFMVPVFAILCNIGYTFGWISEIIKRREPKYAPKLFIKGLKFTLFWVFLVPSIWVVIAIIDEIKKIVT